MHLIRVLIYILGLIFHYILLNTSWGFAKSQNLPKRMNVVKEISRINNRELRSASSASASWHQDYSHSAYVYIGGLAYGLSEGDVICVFSQFGEVADVNLIRDKTTGKSKGFCFLAYEDQRSTVLAVDNFNGAKLLGRVLRVDHVKDYKPPKDADTCPPGDHADRDVDDIPPHQHSPSSKEKKKKKDKKSKKSKEKRHHRQEET